MSDHLALYHPTALIASGSISRGNPFGSLAENSFSFVANCPVSISDPLGLEPFNWGSFCGWLIAGSLGGAVAGNGPGAVGGAIAGGGGYFLDWFFNNFWEWDQSWGISDEQYQKNYGTLPGKYQ
jgi:hypothetical protein